MFNYDNLSKIGIKVIRIFFIIFALLFALFNSIFTARIDNLVSNIPNFEFGLSFIYIALIFLIILLLILLIKRHFFGFSDKTMLIVFLSTALVVSVYWLITNDYKLVNLDDAYNVYRSAKAVSEYNYNALGTHTYINTYPNNLGLLTYEFIFIRLLGEIGALYGIRIVNIIFMLLGYYYLYKITDVLFDNKIINCTMVYLMFFSGQFIFYSFFAYGNCLSYSSAIISVYYLIKFIKKETLLSLVLSMLFISFSIFIKMNSLIIFIAELLYLFLHFIKTKKIFIVFAMLVNIILVYLGTTGVQNFWSVRGECDYKTSKLPLICWVAYGLNYEEDNPGHYFPEFEQFHWDNDYVPEYTAAEADRYINEAKNAFINNPYLGIRFFVRKYLSSWTNPQFEAFDQYRNSELTDLNRDIIGGNINSFMENIWDATLSIVAIGLLAFLFINKKDRKIIDYIGCVIVIGGFLFHIVWEVKAIYLYQYYMYLLPYAAYGLVSLMQNKLNISVR